MKVAPDDCKVVRQQVGKEPLQATIAIQIRWWEMNPEVTAAGYPCSWPVAYSPGYDLPSRMTPTQWVVYSSGSPS